jgi:hypothetical protein
MDTMVAEPYVNHVPTVLPLFPSPPLDLKQELTKR